ncbi:unnamed protein product, partial [Oncorhynchus mykiss]
EVSMLDVFFKCLFSREGNSPDHHEAITYGQLLGQVCRCSNTLKQMGVRKGDRVAIYLPMIPELVYTMLACTRIGAVHSIVGLTLWVDLLPRGGGGFCIP